MEIENKKSQEFSLPGYLLSIVTILIVAYMSSLG